MAAAKKAKPTAITKLSEASSAGHRNWLIYGDSGAGKTVLAGTAPKLLFLTVEAGGTESAKGFGSEADEWVCDTWKELGAAAKWLREGGASEYDWVAMDSLSEMEEVCWADHLEEMAEAKSNRSIYKPALEDYQIIGNKIKKMVNTFNRLPCSVLYTAQPMAVNLTNAITEEETTKTMPLLGSQRNGALSQKVCGMVTLVGYLTVRKPRGKDENNKRLKPFRRLVLQGGDTVIAKNRHVGLPTYIDNPNIAKMDGEAGAAKMAEDPEEQEEQEGSDED